MQHKLEKEKEGEFRMAHHRHVRRIDLAILRENIRLLRSAVPASTRLMAVVKADAYGHGMVPVARNALAAGADMLAVALVKEGVLLRQAGVTADVLVLGAALPADMQQAVQHDLTLAACSSAMIHEIQKAAQACGRRAQIHLKLDTGMGRIGVRTEEEVREVLLALTASPDVRLTGAFTHFADADGEDLVYTRRQLERFLRLTALLPEGILRHCANSAAIHRLPEAALDMVRAGITMYGYPPVDTELPLRPFMTWHTYVTHVKDVAAGESISYGCTYTTDRPSRIATIACGYGDGYHRAASGRAEVIIHGQRVPVVGRICMDQMMADVSALENVQPGDEVILTGGSGEATVTAEDIARWAGTISYEVLLSATGRVAREWQNDCDA